MLVFIVLIGLLQITMGQVTSNDQVEVIPDYRYIKFQLKDYVTENKSLAIMTTVSVNLNVTHTADLLIGKYHVVKNMPINQKVYFTLFDNTNFVEAKTKDASLAASSVTVVPGKPLNLHRCGTDDLCWETPQNIQSAGRNEDLSIEYHIHVCDYNQLTEENTNCVLKAVTVDRLLTYSNKSQSTTVLKLPVSAVTRNGNYELENNFFPALKISEMERTKDLALVVKSVTLANTDGKADQLNIRLDPSKEPTAPGILAIMPVVNTGKVFVAWTVPDAWLTAETVKYRVEYRKVNDFSFTNVNFNKLGGTWPNDTTLVTNWGIQLMSSNGANLEKETNYEFRVGIYESNYGSSKWTYGKFKTDTWTSMSIVTSPSIMPIMTSALIVVSRFIDQH